MHITELHGGRYCVTQYPTNTSVQVGWLDQQLAASVRLRHLVSFIST